MLKDRVKVGETYFVMVNQVDETSLICTQSAKNGIIPISDTAKVAEIRALCEAASE